MKIKLEIRKDWIERIGTYLTPVLDIDYDITETEQIIYFNNEKEIIELYERYKEDITYDWDEEKTISLERFLGSDHILILLGCIDGDGHEVLYS
tara:strand:+ start:373 stop:654 length:282 start_codon:yes stop_codon:yes gene_type:complete